MPPKFNTFASTAVRQRGATNATPALDPADAVAAAHPLLQDLECLAIPGAPCPESVLRLALACEKFGKKLEELTDFDITNYPPPLRVGLPAATPAQLNRRLERLGMETFPMYVQVPPVGAAAMVAAMGRIVDLEYTLWSPKMRHRPDNWAIIFVPPFGAHPGHYTFARIEPQERPKVRRAPIVVFTAMPITDLDPLVYWRCVPTKTNMSAYLAKRELGQACHCCQMLTCPHQVLFKSRHPDMRTLVMEKNLCFDGCFRAQIIKSTDLDGYQVSMAPGGEVEILNPLGSVSRHPFMWGYPAVERPGIDLGDGFKPFQLQFPIPFCGHDGGQFNRLRKAGFPGTLIWVTSRLLRTGLTFWERAWPCYYWKYDIATEEYDEVIRPYQLRLSHLEKRNKGVLGTLLGIFITVVKLAFIYLWFRKLRNFMELSGKLLALDLYFVCAAWKSTKRFIFGVVSLPFVFLTGHVKSVMRLVFSERGFGAVPGTRIAIPKLEEVNSRLAVRKEVTRDVATDVFRRAMNETKWAQKVTPAEFETWLQTVVNSEGTAVSIPGNKPGYCITCRTKAKLYRRECKLCQKKRRLIAPEIYLPDIVTAYIGRVGLHSREFVLPSVEFKDTVKITLWGKRVADIEALFKTFKSFPVETSCRGWNSGPAIDGNVPQCFPRGYAVAVQAFCVRLGARRLHQPSQRFYSLLTRMLCAKVSSPLEIESRELFLSHFSGDKLVKMLEAFSLLDQGYSSGVDPLNPVCIMSGFQKAEKSFSYKLVGTDFFAMKDEEKPRFICCPEPMFLAEIGPTTHAQLKWLKHTFGVTHHLHYAGCDSPEDLNSWLNWTLSELPEPVSIVDDIVAIDSNHNSLSMDMHDELRWRQFPFLSSRVETLFQAEKHLRIRVGPYVLEVDDVNGSGVSDTSYKNSAPCLFIRLLSITHGVRSLHQSTDEEVLQLASCVASIIFTSASGDDGLTRSPRFLLGVDIMSEEFRSRYEECWSMAGFSVKVAILPEHRWRMATYLAMRPVWAGKRYEWAPEPARRLKGMFWQIDNSMNPDAWSRGVATQVLQQGRHCPVLADICEWFLASTSGAVARVEQRPYSPWNDYTTAGRRNARADSEFCQDYHVSESDLARFRGELARIHSVYVNLSSGVLRRVLEEES